MFFCLGSLRNTWNLPKELYYEKKEIKRKKKTTPHKTKQESEVERVVEEVNKTAFKA